MQFNVAQLLKESVGATREYWAEGTIPSGGELISPLRGRVELLRTDRGLLVKATLTADIKSTCSRCLEEFHQSITLRLEEEFFPKVDIFTGTYLPRPEDADAFTIDEHHILDLTEAVRQYALLALPMKPLCRPDCAGICSQCGANLNQGPCRCATSPGDARWSPLEKLLSGAKKKEN